MEISLAAAVPIVGDVATVGKYTVKGINAANKVYTVTKADKEIAERLIENKVPKEKFGEMFQEAKATERLEKGADALGDFTTPKAGLKETGLPIEGLSKNAAVWELDPLKRGTEIENILAKTEYEGMVLQDGEAYRRLW